MVYCVNCGTKNPDDAAVCAKCGKPIASVDRGRTKQEREMCFGMPYHWAAIVVGIFIIVFGGLQLYQQYAHISFDTGSLVLVLLGIVVLLGGIYRYSRRSPSSK